MKPESVLFSFPINMKKKEVPELVGQVMKFFLEDEEAEYKHLLQEQFQKGNMVDITSSSAGFFVKFDFTGKSVDDLPEKIEGHFDPGVLANIEGMEGGIGFIFRIVNGKLREIEGFSFEEKIPENVQLNNFQRYET